MSRLYHRPGPPADRKVMLATGCYGNMEPAFSYALAESTAALKDAGIACEVAILAGDCHVDHARNRLVRLFLKGDCTDLVFLDADVRWEAKDLIGLLACDRDVVACVYPMKKDEEAFPVSYLPGGPVIDADGLIEVEGVPAGFLRIRRSVLETLADRCRSFVHDNDPDKTPTPLIFERALDQGGRYWGGDYVFGFKWRELGGKLYVLPQPFLEHHGAASWRGSLFSHLRRAKGQVLIEALVAIREKREDAILLRDMLIEWANPWSATLEQVAALIMLAREAQGPILECGSGLTSLILAAANPNVEIHALEHNQAWIAKIEGHRPAGLYEAHHKGSLNIHYAPLANGWYTVPDIPYHYALALIDGPPHHGDRDKFLRTGLTADVYVLDDMKYESTDRAYRELGGRKVIMGDKRKFAIIDTRQAA